MIFKMPKGGYYRFTIKIMPVEGGQPVEFQKIVKAKSYESAHKAFYAWLKDKAAKL